MALGALFLVVLSAFLHAAWNAAAKGSGAPAPFVFLADLAALVVLIPAFFFFRLADLTPEVWLMVLADRRHPRRLCLEPDPRLRERRPHAGLSDLALDSRVRAPAGRSAPRRAGEPRRRHRHRAGDDRDVDGLDQRAPRRPQPGQPRAALRLRHAGRHRGVLAGRQARDGPARRQPVARPGAARGRLLRAALRLLPAVLLRLLAAPARARVAQGDRSRPAARDRLGGDRELRELHADPAGAAHRAGELRGRDAPVERGVRGRARAVLAARAAQPRAVLGALLTVVGVATIGLAGA